MLFLINCRYGSTFTKVVPPQTGLPHCLVLILILIPIRANAKFMVVLSSVFIFLRNVCKRRDSVVGIAVSYGLDGSGFESP